MIKVEYKAKAGMEDFFELAIAKKETYEADLEKAKADAIAEIEKQFEERKVRIETVLNEVADKYEVEVPDEIAVEENSDENTVDSETATY